MADIRFNDLDGNLIEIEIEGFKDGVELTAVSKEPLVFDIQEIKGQTKWFPTVMHLVLELKLSSPSVFYYEDFITNSYLIRVKRAGIQVWVGYSQKYNYSEPLTTPPYQVTIKGFQDISRWGKTDFEPSSDPECDDQTVVNQLPTLVIESPLLDNSFFDMSRIETRERWFKGQKLLDIANKLNATFLCTYYHIGNIEDPTTKRRWVHNYLTYTTDRDLTDSARETPRISWGHAVKEINIKRTLRPEEVFLGGVYDTEMVNNVTQQGTSFLSKSFEICPLTSKVISFRVDFKMVDFRYILTPNQQYLDDLANNNIGDPNSLSDGYVLFIISLLLVNPITGGGLFFETKNGGVTFLPDQTPTGADSWKEFQVGSTPIAVYRWQKNSESVIDISYECKPLLREAVPGSNDYVFDFFNAFAENEVFFYNNASQQQVNGGTFSVSANRIEVGVYAVLENEEVSEQVEVVSDVDGEVINYEVDVDNYKPVSINEKDPDLVNELHLSNSSNFNQDEPYSITTIEWLKTYLSEPIGVIDLTMQCDQDMITRPVKPFMFDYGKGLKLFRIKKGKIYMRSNLFKGQIHEIIQS